MADAGDKMTLCEALAAAAEYAEHRRVTIALGRDGLRLLHVKRGIASNSASQVTAIISWCEIENVKFLSSVLQAAIDMVIERATRAA